MALDTDLSLRESKRTQSICVRIFPLAHSSVSIAHRVVLPMPALPSIGPDTNCSAISGKFRCNLSIQEIWATLLGNLGMSLNVRHSTLVV